MTIDRMVELLEIEHTCMLRGAHDDCDRNCADCDLVQDDGELHEMYTDVIALLKEQEKKRITLHKKHVITWSRSDEFSMRKLYEAICETLLDEGELFIARTDNHEKVEFVFYVAERQ